MTTKLFAIVILVLSSKLLSQVNTAYQIYSTYENGSAEIEINNTCRK